MRNTVYRTDDRTRDDVAPVPRSSRSDRIRFAVVQVGTLAVVVGSVVVVSAALPFLPGWLLPSVLLVLAAACLGAGRRAASVGSTATARVWAAWAGTTATLGVSGVVNLVGLGGALVALLLVVIALNAGIALWFRSSVHFAAVQVAALLWGLLAHVYGTAPWATLVAGLAGSWWTARVGAHRVVLTATTVVVPSSVALLVHPLTHRTGAVDAADVVVLVSAIAGATTQVGAGCRPAVVTVWRTTRAVAVVVLVGLLLLGAVPAVAAVLAPSPTTRSWPAVLAAAAAVLGCATVVALRPVRRGTALVLALCGGQVVTVAAFLLAGAPASTTVALGTLTGVVVAALPRSTPPDGLSGTADLHTGLLRIGLLLLPVLWTLLVGLPSLVTAGLLVVGGVAVAVSGTRPLSRPPVWGHLRADAVADSGAVAAAVPGRRTDTEGNR